MNQDKPLTAEQWVERYQGDLKNQEALASFHRMSKEEMFKVAGLMITDKMMALKQTEAENKRDGTYTTQDTINRLQSEVAFLYFQWLQLHQFINTLMDTLAKHKQRLAPEELEQLVYLRRLANLTEQIDKHWTKDRDQWPFFLD